MCWLQARKILFFSFTWQNKIIESEMKAFQVKEDFNKIFLYVDNMSLINIVLTNWDQLLSISTNCKLITKFHDRSRQRLKNYCSISNDFLRLMSAHQLLWQLTTNCRLLPRNLHEKRVGLIPRELKNWENGVNWKMRAFEKASESFWKEIFFHIALYSLKNSFKVI